MEYLEQLVGEWYEYQGYFVHRDLWVGVGPDDSYEYQLDVVAFHPLHRRLVHIEQIALIVPGDEVPRHGKNSRGSAAS